MILRLRRRLERALRDGHPWIFRDALGRPPRLAHGACVEIVGSAGRVVASGFWDADSPIAVRVLQPGPTRDPAALVAGRIREAFALRRRSLDLDRTTAFRWIHGEGDRLPGIHVDLYGDVAVVRFDGEGARAFYRGLGPMLRAVFPLRAAVDRQTGARLVGRAVPDRLEVLEHGLRFEVSPGVGGKGGLFLDQRENRAAIGRLSKGRRVLNLFGYTGGFSLYAVRGGAVSTDTVDVARPALEAAKRNFALNGFPLEAAGFHARDAFEFLEAAERRWDLVISDPPSFAPRKSARETARRAYTRLHRLAAASVEPGGLLAAASCSSHFPLEDFLGSLHEGARQAGRAVEVDAVRGAGADHPSLPGFPEGDYLKFVVGRVRVIP
jgi:23S rRNA (cytosine1962-C5)-methyltransferase